MTGGIKRRVMRKIAVILVHRGVFFGDSGEHKVLIYVEYRAGSDVFQNIDPHPPLLLASVSSPRTIGGGYILAGR